MVAKSAAASKIIADLVMDRSPGKKSIYILPVHSEVATVSAPQNNSKSKRIFASDNCDIPLIFLQIAKHRSSWRTVAIKSVDRLRGRLVVWKSAEDRRPQKLEVGYRIGE